MLAKIVEFIPRGVSTLIQPSFQKKSNENKPKDNTNTNFYFF